ncbi:MAG TPA: hypothetical protein ENN09_04075 [Planctomycetes bacterium]|nr:hypothetical protein [Planctomycetota bacterium]
MRIVMYLAALLVAVVGIAAAFLKTRGKLPIPEEHLPLAEELARTLVYALLLAGIGGIYGAIKRQKSGADTHRTQPLSGVPTIVERPAQPDEPADDDLFLVTPEEKP